MNDSHSDALVFFGATGDLAYKKIFPALQAMVKRGHLGVRASLTAKQPNGLIHLACMGALFLPAAVRLGMGLVRAVRRMERRHAPLARF